MSAHRQLIAALSEGSRNRIAALDDVARAEQLVDAYRVDVLAEAEVEIRLATERNRAEYPDVEAMRIRRLGMRAAERVVEGMQAEMAEEKAAGTVCGACGERVVRFADDRTGGGWMHARGNDDASDDPAAGADHAATPVTVPEEKASAAFAAPEVTPALHAVILDAVRAFQIDRHLPGGYDQQLADHVTAAVAPLVQAGGEGQ